MIIEKIREIIELLNNESSNCEEADYNITNALYYLKCVLASQYWKEKGFNIVSNQKYGNWSYRVNTPGLYDVAWLNEWASGAQISNSKKQPEVGKWVFRLLFNNGVYIFGSDYDTESFDNFYEELIEKYKPDFKDDLNHHLYWYVDNPNASKVANDVSSIYKKYEENRENNCIENRIKELEEEIAQLRGELQKED